MHFQPEPTKDHPVVMSLFAADCLASMHAMVQSLEVDLGPDTADLTIRIGLHSGPVTAGVLRGGKP
jgi:class 3 adenylate cyclase